MNEDLPRLLRAIAQGSNAKDAKHDIIFNAAADEIERLRGVLVDANNNWRHDFDREVTEATDKLFKKLAAHRTDPFHRKRVVNQ